MNSNVYLLQDIPIDKFTGQPKYNIMGARKYGEIKKYYSSLNNDENYQQSLSILAGAKKEVFEFFDNVQCEIHFSPER